jgi:hypothetical protein
MSNEREIEKVILNLYLTGKSEGRITERGSIYPLEDVISYLKTPPLIANLSITINREHEFLCKGCGDFVQFTFNRNSNHIVQLVEDYYKTID